MKRTRVSKRAVAMVCTFALALAVVVVSGTQEASAKTLVKHVLNGTYYDTSSSGASASCSTANCVATANMYTESISCPGATGVNCTYEVNIVALTSIAASGSGPAEGLYQFLIDGVMPAGGGTDSNGFFAWGAFGAGQGITFESAYSVTSQVKNTSANQSHSIIVNVGCAGLSGGPGCSVNSGLASLTVRVLKP